MCAYVDTIIKNFFFKYSYSTFLNIQDIKKLTISAIIGNVIDK